MRTAFRSCHVALSLGLALALASCASTPSAPLPDSASASLRIVDESELVAAFGANYSDNPFISPTTLLMGKANEFVVLELSLALPSPVPIEVEASVLDADGDVVARLYDCQEMSEYIGKFRLDDNGGNELKRVLEQNCLPSSSFTRRPGRKNYYVVLVGRYPRPADCRIEAEVFLDGASAASFSAPLPATIDAKKKKSKR